LTKPIYPSTLFDAIMDGFGKAGVKEAGRKKPFTTRASMYRKPLKGIRILVAEDNPTNQQVAQAILEGAGIAVTIVNNGEAAVEAIRNTPFDAVLMDIQMPRMNGYKATRLIRQLANGPSIPIIAMTAHAMKGDEEKCLDAGMDGYISKPVNQDRLFHTLWRLLRTREPSPEGRNLQDAGTFRLPDADAVRPAGIDIVTVRTHRLKATLRPPGTTARGSISHGTREALNFDGPTLTRILVAFVKITGIP
jgi:two-component system sensor histidine kinase/response regulator